MCRCGPPTMPHMEPISVFDIFKIGVGPSSSHTLGPWRGAQQFVAKLRKDGRFAAVRRVRTDLFGSLAKTGRGHGTGVAVILALSGEDYRTCDTRDIEGRARAIAASVFICWIRIELSECRTVFTPASSRTAGVASEAS